MNTSGMTISLVVAISANGVIGKDGELPWHIPQDLKRFKEITNGHHVIMGRKTYESIVEKLGHPLPGRTNIVLTRDTNYKTEEGVVVVNTLVDAINYAKENGENEAMVIGGAEIYKLAEELAEKVYLTRVLVEVEGDVVFFELDEKLWKEDETKTEAHLENEIPFYFKILERVF